MKRVILLVVTNIAILVVLSVIGNLLFGSMQGLGGLLGFAFIFGMGGAFISLAISKWIAKMAVGARVIEQPRDNTESWLLNTVHNQARQVGIAPPEVAVYDSPEPNAFATGPTRNNSLVAVSTGLLRRMEPKQVEAVLAHEVSHAANGDMVTLTLIQGVLNTFVIVLAHVIGRALHRDDDGGFGMGHFVTVIVLQILLGILASIVVCWFSRQREYRADAGGAALAGRENMIGALQALHRSPEPEHMPEQVAAFGISGVRKGGLRMLLASHPHIEDRIAALREGSYASGIVS